MSKVALLVLSMALIASLALSCSDEPELVRFAADGDYFPYNFLDDAGEVDGFEADLIDEVCRRANLECAWVITPWDGIIDSLIAKEFDVIATGMSINEERDLVIDFTQPYLPPTPSIYVALASASEDALNGKIGAGSPRCTPLISRSRGPTSWKLMGPKRYLRRFLRARSMPSSWTGNSATRA